MSTAVLISGQMRAAEQCVESIRSAFPGADFFIHCVRDEDAHKADLFGAVAVDSYVQQPIKERDHHHRQKGPSKMPGTKIRACLPAQDHKG